MQGQVALNWAISRKGITSAIVGARNARQAEENSGAGGWRLTDEDAAQIDRIGRELTDTLPHYVSFFMSKTKE
ncbi:MAG TPA: aldo/keto reductase, partial [Armatimonadota bacterium]|nr:aldo/keto reductase [Armatimonadota bacterium]